MAVPPQILQMIASPTSGKLGEIGQTIAANRQQAIQNQQQAEKSDMEKQAFDIEKADIGSKITGAYSNAMLDWKKENKDATEEEFEAYQLEQWNALDPAHRQFVPKGTQTLPQFEAGRIRSEEIQRALHPELYKDKEPKSSFDVVTLVDPDDPEHELSFHKDDKAEVRDRLDKGWTVRAGKGQTINLGGKGETKYEEERMKQQALEMSKVELSAETAHKNIESLMRFKKASVEGYEGSMEPVMAGMRNFVASFGYESEKLTDVRFMEQALGEIQSQFMRELGARGLTDKDMEILQRALPRVETDKASRDAVADILIKSNAKTIAGFEDALRQESEFFPELKVRKPKWLGQYQEQRDNVETFSAADAIVRGE